MFVRLRRHRAKKLIIHGTNSNSLMSNPAKYEESDAELIVRFNSGEPEAFDRLVQRHYKRGYQIAYGVLGNAEDSEEVAQDAFFRIYRALNGFRGDSEFTTWMYRIVLNLARNKYRWNKSRGSQLNISIDAPINPEEERGKGMDVPDRKASPEEQVCLLELKKNVSEELEKLPPLYREVLVMRNIHNLSYEEIADVLGCKLGTIKSRIARAREELRKRLEKL